MTIPSDSPRVQAQETVKGWLGHVPPFLQAGLGSIAAIVFIMMLSGSLDIFNRYMMTYAIEREQSVSDKKFGTAMDRMLESVKRLEIVASELTAVQAKLGQLDTRLVVLADKIHDLDKRIYSFETSRAEAKPTKPTRLVARSVRTTH